MAAAAAEAASAGGADLEALAAEQQGLAAAAAAAAAARAAAEGAAAEQLGGVVSRVADLEGRLGAALALAPAPRSARSPGARPGDATPVELAAEVACLWRAQVPPVRTLQRRVDQTLVRTGSCRPC